MIYRYNFNAFFSDPVDYPVISKNDLANGRVVYFWNNSSQVWKHRKAFDSTHDIQNEQTGIMNGIFGDKTGDYLKIIGGLPCPSYFSHPSILCFNAAWGSVCPASAC